MARRPIGRLVAVIILAFAALAFPAHGDARYCATHDTLSFGNRALGTTTTQSASVWNCGGEPWQFTEVRVQAANGSAWRIESACATGLVLAPGDRCRIDITFEPVAAGQASGALWLRQTTATPDQLLTFYGRGVTSSTGTAAIAFDPAALDFGVASVGETQRSRTVLLMNTGSAPLTPRALVVSGAASRDFAILSPGDPADCAVGRPVAPGASCLLHSTFTPATEGARDARLVVDAAELPALVALPLRGIGRLTSRGTLETIEFHHAERRHWFLTAVQDEAAHIDAGGVGPGWVRTGASFRVWTFDSVEAPADALPVCRFFGAPGKGPDAHFFTADARECEALRTSAYWLFEGFAFRTVLPVAAACPAGYDVVTRLYRTGTDATDVRHRYVVDVALVASMVSEGWLVEGPVFCSPR